MQTKIALSSTPFTAVPVASHRASRRSQRQCVKPYAAERNEHTGMVGSINTHLFIVFRLHHLPSISPTSLCRMYALQRPLLTNTFLFAYLTDRKGSDCDA
jgi:hypothetical protein